MAIKRKLVKKESDTLLDLTQAKEKAATFFERNQKTIIGAVAVVVLLAGGWYVYNNLIRQPREERAMAQMWKAQQQFEQDSFLVALENPGGGFPGFIEIAQKYGNTKAGNLANYYAGVAYLNLGSFDNALSYLDDYKPSGSFGPALRHAALGDAYSELNQMDKALMHYKNASKSIENIVLSPYYFMNLGIFYKTRNDQEKYLIPYNRSKSNIT